MLVVKDIQQVYLCKLFEMDIALTGVSGPVLMEIYSNSNIVFQEEAAEPLFDDQNHHNELKNIPIYLSINIRRDFAESGY